MADIRSIQNLVGKPKGKCHLEYGRILLKMDHK
jgi:hypothetical protein